MKAGIGSYQEAIKLTKLRATKFTITRINQNLISNAAKYSRKGVKSEVKVSAYDKDEWIVILFSDNGEGVDLEKYGHKIFGMFERINVQIAGTGIGLYMVKKIMEDNDGKVEVESLVGEGSTFKLYFKKFR